MSRREESRARLKAAARNRLGHRGAGDRHIRYVGVTERGLDAADRAGLAPELLAPDAVVFARADP